MIYIHVSRVAQSAVSGEEAPSIAKDLIDSEDPKHTLFCHETANVNGYQHIMTSHNIS